MSGVTPDLLARLERATDGSRELDAEIARHLVLTGEPPFHILPEWTTSIDAAASLAPNDAWCMIKRPFPAFDRKWLARFVVVGDIRHFDGVAETEPLARCLAALRVMMEAGR